jgi:hypothetical protein
VPGRTSPRRHTASDRDVSRWASSLALRPWRAGRPSPRSVHEPRSRGPPTVARPHSRAEAAPDSRALCPRSKDLRPGACRCVPRGVRGPRGGWCRVRAAGQPRRCDSVVVPHPRRRVARGTAEGAVTDGEPPGRAARRRDGHGPGTARGGSIAPGPGSGGPGSAPLRVSSHADRHRPGRQSGRAKARLRLGAALTRRNEPNVERTLCGPV